LIITFVGTSMFFKKRREPWLKSDSNKFDNILNLWNNSKNLQE
jgi:hypothetical protein